VEAGEDEDAPFLESRMSSCNRQSCYGRVWFDEVQPTVVTRAEPHNLRLLHPTQNRVLSIRENARCQGFPDHFVFAGMGGGMRHSDASVPTRYKQVSLEVSCYMQMTRN
jgi:DNA (cytosine-5)-methyltransferase 1